MNNEEMKAHFEERKKDIAETMELISTVSTPSSAVAQLLCAISYDIALMAQHQLEKEYDNS